MKIIIDSDMIDKIFGEHQPTVIEILKNKTIKNMVKDCQVTDVYQDDMDANDIGNYVIKVIPLLNRSKKSNGK